MKKDIDILVSKKEDLVALAKRREDYAVKRDLQAREFNDAITKRSASEAINKVRCEKCGKQYAAGTESGNTTTCPECEKSDILDE